MKKNKKKKGIAEFIRSNQPTAPEPDQDSNPSPESEKESNNAGNQESDPGKN